MKLFNERTECGLIRRSSIRYVIPMILGMLFSQSAPAVDAICVSGKLGEEALSALITVMPLGYVISMIGTLGGIGAGVFISKCSGSGDRARAARTFTRSVVLMAVVSAIFALLTGLFQEPILTFLSTTEENRDFARDYLLVTIAGGPILTLAFASEYFLINDNNPNLGMIASIAGAAVNMLVDYLGMYVFHGGIRVAAVGTVLGSAATVLVSLLHMRKKDRLCRFVHLGRREGDPTLWELVKPGWAEGIMYFLLGVQLVVQNYVLSESAGTSGLGNSAIIENLQLFFTIIVAGTTDALFPVVSAYHGEQNDSGMLLAKRTLARISYVLLIPTVLILCIFPGIITSLYAIEDPVMMQTLPWSIRVVSVTMLINFLNTLLMDFLSSTEHEAKAAVAMTIEIVSSCVLALLLEKAFTVDAPWYADLLSNGIVMIYLACFAKNVFRGLVRFYPENLRMLRGGKLNVQSLRQWETESAGILSEEEQKLVSEKLTAPLLASTPEGDLNSTWTILERNDGHLAVILRAENRRKGLIQVEDEEEEEEKVVFNECMQSEFFGMQRWMLVLDAGGKQKNAEG